MLSPFHKPQHVTTRTQKGLKQTNVTEMFLLFFHLVVLRIAATINGLQTHRKFMMPIDYIDTFFGPQIDILRHDVVPVANSYGYNGSV